MASYKKNEARAWALENMRGVANVVIPTFTQDLKRLNETAIRYDIEKEIEYGFYGTLLVSEVAISVGPQMLFLNGFHIIVNSGTTKFRMKAVMNTGR